MSIDSIYIAMTGLDAFERGLRVISNNTANLNTPGFKSSVLQFADLFHSGGGAGGSVARDYGYGLTTLGTKLDFSQGQLRTTGNGLDLAVDGLGFFVLRDEAGRVRYTRDGQFTFGADGVLVSTTTGEQVLAFDGGTLGPVRISDLKANAAKPTGTITFTGNLSSTATSHTIGSVVVIDAAGASHSLTVKLEQAADSPGTWNVTLLDGAATVGTAQVAFLAGRPDPARSKASFTYGPAGQPEMALTLDLSTNVTSFDTGSRSTLALGSQDGHGAGELTGTSFDEAIRTDLLAPSGLDHTWAQPGEVPSGPLTVGGTTPHDDVVDPTSAVMPSVSLSSALLGAGSMAADAADAAMWGYLLYGGHVIDPSLVAEMIADPQPDPNVGPYALGTSVITVGTDTLIGHAGGGVDYPYTSVTMVVVGDQPIGIAVLTPQAADHGSQIFDLFMQLHSIAAG